MAVSLNSVAESLAGYLVPGDGATFVATSTSGDWPATTRLRVVSAAGVETAFTPVIASTLATWTLTVAEVTALIGTRTSGQLQARITHGTGDALRGILAGPLTLISEWTGVRGTQSLGTVVVGPAGPTAVSADVGNVASLGTDGLIYVAPSAGTVASVNGETGTVVLSAADVGAAPALGADDNYVTDVEKAALHSHSNKTALDAVSGTNTGDQDLSGLVTKSLVDAKGDLIVGTAADTPARLAVGTDGQVLTADAASAGGVKWAAGALAPPVMILQGTESASAPWWSGLAPIGSDIAARAIFGAGSAVERLVGIPMHIPRRITFDAAAINCTTSPGAGGLLRVGIWASVSGGGGPAGAPLWDSGAIDCSTTGVKTITGLNVTIPAGTVWVMGTATSGVQATTARLNSSSLVSLNAAAFTTNGALAFAHSSAAAPSSALPTITDGSMVRTADSTTGAPVVQVKVIG